MDEPLNYLDHIRNESRRFADCLNAADPQAPVPCCPDWTAADLLWHLTEVQLFWAVIVRDRLSSPAASEAAKPDRPDAYQDLMALFGDATAQLTAALDSTSDDTAVWSWSTDQTAGFVRRRQAHEALIHRLDAEQTVGEVTDFDAALACDGVDEALRVMYGGLPAWARFAPDDEMTTRVRAADSGAEWTLVLGRATGTSPDSGTSYDEDSLRVVDDPNAAVSCTVEANARDLDVWLWGRGSAETLSVDGDRVVFDRLQALVHEGIQ
ncbi:MAG: maleylpyruvate isomerase family mycothiol-dependent enzyme [Nocardioidaceae bacterium]